MVILLRIRDDVSIILTVHVPLLTILHDKDGVLQR